MEKIFEELIEETMYTAKYSVAMNRKELLLKSDVLKLLQQVREATKREAININDEVILFNMGVDLESDVEFRDVNAEILNLPTDRIKLTDENAN